MYGLNIDPNNPRGNPNASELQALGVQMVRYTFYDSSGGDQVDPNRVRFYQDRAGAYNQVGIRSLVILTYDTYPNKPSPGAGDGEWDQHIARFARRAGQIAQALAQWQPAFQVWNEPDHKPDGNYVPTVPEAAYGRMLKATYDAIKRVNSNFVVVTAGLATGDPSWLTRVVQSQGNTLPADIVAFHPYGQRPERSWPKGGDWGHGYVGDLLNAYYTAGQRKPIWITENGVKSDEVPGGLNGAAEFLQRFYKTMTTSFSDKVQEVHWFCYSDGMVSPFGLVDANGTRKPIYGAFQKVATATKVQPPPVIITQPPVVISEPPVVVPPVPPVPPVSTDLGQLTSEVTRLQAAVSTLQSQIQQVLSQQTLLQSRLDQLQTGVVTPPIEPVSPSQPPIQNIIAQLAHHPTAVYPTRALNQIRRLVIHHTVVIATAQQIATAQVSRKEWPGIGYHFFITPEGIIQQTNQLTTVSRHTGTFDLESVGIGLMGDFTNNPPGAAQFNATAQLTAWLLWQLALPVEALVGHSDLANIQSPGLTWSQKAPQWGELLRGQVRKLLG